MRRAWRESSRRSAATAASGTQPFAAARGAHEHPSRRVRRRPARRCLPRPAPAPARDRAGESRRVARSSTMASGRRYQARSASPPSTAAPAKTSRTSHRSRIRGRRTQPSQPAIQPTAPHEQQLLGRHRGRPGPAGRRDVRRRRQRPARDGPMARADRAGAPEATPPPRARAGPADSTSRPRLYQCAGHRGLGGRPTGEPIRRGVERAALVQLLGRRVLGRPSVPAEREQRTASAPAPPRDRRKRAAEPADDLLRLGGEARRPPRPRGRSVAPRQQPLAHGASRAPRARRRRPRPAPRRRAPRRSGGPDRAPDSGPAGRAPLRRSGDRSWAARAPCDGRRGRAGSGRVPSPAARREGEQHDPDPVGNPRARASRRARAGPARRSAGGSAAAAADSPRAATGTDVAGHGELGVPVGGEIEVRRSAPPAARARRRNPAPRDSGTSWFRRPGPRWWRPARPPARDRPARPPATARRDCGQSAVLPFAASAEARPPRPHPRWRSAGSTCRSSVSPDADRAGEPGGPAGGRAAGARPACRRDSTARTAPPG